MAEKKALKLLVCGDVDGKFSQLFHRVATVNKKSGPFDMLLCVGNFFGPDDTEWKQCLDGTLKAPVSIYALGPNLEKDSSFYTKSDGTDLCPNITYLGKKGVLTGATNLKLLYLSGLEGKESDNTHFTLSDIDVLQSQAEAERDFKGVDILLTSQWPKGATKYVLPLEGTNADQNGSQLISQLARAVKPRYHFCGLEGIHYERLPYRNHRVLLEKARHVTRFISLAKVGNVEKRKWLYAFVVTPLNFMESSELVKQPPDVTECPYTFVSQTAISQEPTTQYFYDMNASSDGSKRKNNKNPDFNPKRRQGPWKPAKPTGPCWFCLGSPEVEKHLVVSIGNDIYLALAKGGLVPDHVLICPITHYQATLDLPPDAIAEVEQYKKALRKMYASEGKAPVFFERNFKTQHFQIQVVPISKGAIKHVSSAFHDFAEQRELRLKTMPESASLDIPNGIPYFYAELPDGERLVHVIQKYFPLQFGREVMASKQLLDIADRADWKKCNSSTEEERKMASDFKRSFEAFDFTL